MSFPFLTLILVATSASLSAEEFDKVPQEFLTAVGTGKPAEVMALIDPRLYKEIDPTVLGEWMNAVNKRLGRFKSVDPNNFGKTTSSDGDVKIIDAVGTLLFENGNGSLKIEYQNGKIAKFKLDSLLMNSHDWFSGPSDTSYYRDAAVDFVNNIVRGEINSVGPVMHPALRANVTPTHLSDMSRAFAERLGGVEEVHVVDEHYSAQNDLQSLRVDVLVKGTKATYKSEIKYAFIGLNAKVIEFDLTKKRITE